MQVGGMAVHVLLLLLLLLLLRERQRCWKPVARPRPLLRLVALQLCVMIRLAVEFPRQRFDGGSALEFGVGEGRGLGVVGVLLVVVGAGHR